MRLRYRLSTFQDIMILPRRLSPIRGIPSPKCVGTGNRGTTRARLANTSWSVLLTGGHSSAASSQSPISNQLLPKYGRSVSASFVFRALASPEGDPDGVQPADLTRLVFNAAGLRPPTLVSKDQIPYSAAALSWVSLRRISGDRCFNCRSIAAFEFGQTLSGCG